MFLLPQSTSGKEVAVSPQLFCLVIDFDLSGLNCRLTSFEHHFLYWIIDGLGAVWLLM